MKKLFLLLFLITLTVYTRAQSQKFLVADETTLIVNKTTFKVVTSNEIISDSLNRFKTIALGLSYSRKTDRSGEYIETAYTFKSKDFNLVSEFFKRLNKTK